MKLSQFLFASIRRKILLLFLAGLVLPLLVIVWLSYRTSGRILLEHATEQQERILMEISRDAGLIADQSRRQLAVLGSDPLVVSALQGKSAFPEALIRHFLRENPQWLNLFFYNALGQEAWRSDGPVDLLQWDPFFLETFNLGQNQTPVFNSQGKNLSRFGIAIDDQGELAGIVSATLDLFTIGQTLAQVRSLNSIMAAVFDDRGMIIGANLTQQEWKNLEEQIDPPRAALEILRSPIQVLHREIRTAEGPMLFSATKVREFISRPQPVPGENWFLAMLTPSSRAFDELRTFQLKAGLFLLVVLATTAVLLFWLSRRISRPLEQMAAFSQKVSSGKREARLQVKGNDEVAMLSNSLNDLAESLGHYEKELVRVETLASLGKMSSLIAHEIRNPLNAIKGSVQYLQLKHPKDPLILDYSGIILNKVDRLARFVENLLKFSRLPAPDIQQIDAEQLFAQALEPLQELAGQHGVVFQIDLDPIKFLHCDEDQVCQLIQNVARNALEAMPKGGLFKIQARQDAHTVCIAFRDTGPGVPSEIRSRLFLPFTTHKKGGTGLGLHLCCLIAENHHGTFEYEPSDEGAFFILKIPYRE